MKKLLRRPMYFKGLTLGLDLHKKFIEYANLNENGDQIDGGKFDSNEKILRRFIEEAKKRGEVQVCIEACGCFMWVYDLLVDILGSKQVHVAQPSKIKVIANSQEKNDANDAWWLAYLLFEGRLPESFVACGDLRRLRISTRELRAYTNQRSDLLRRFGAHLAQAGQRLPKTWHTSKVKRTKVKELLKTLKTESCMALSRLYVQIFKLSKEIVFWKKQIKSICESFPAIKTMVEELPGLGITTAATVYTELGDPKRFRNEKA